MALIFRRGDRVNTPYGPGTIVFVRMAAPDFVNVEAASVRLDARTTDINYVGTTMPADKIEPLKPITVTAKGAR